MSDKEDEIQIDMKALKENFSKFTSKVSKISLGKHWKTYVIIFMILIAIVLSSVYRLYPLDLPFAEQNARSNVENNVLNQIAAQIQQQNPNLPANSIELQAREQYAQYYSQNKDSIEAQVDAVAAQIKDSMQNSDGQTYLLAIDPYVWYSLAKWEERTGFFGNEVVDGEERFSLRNGRIGEPADFVWPSAIIGLTHDIIKMFNPEQDIFKTAFIMPVILIALAVIPAFFLGKKIGGLWGGFFAAVLFVLSPTILGRTAAGFSDTDAYTFIFPFLIIWLFLEAIEAKNFGTSLVFSGLAALAAVIFRFFWGGWWFTFNLILGLAGIYILYRMAYYMLKQKNEFFRKALYVILGLSVILGFIFGSGLLILILMIGISVSLTGLLILVKALMSKFNNKEKEYVSAVNHAGRGWSFLGTYIVGTILFAIIISALVGANIGQQVNSFANAPLEPLNFVFGFKAAAEGVTAGGGTGYALWPNVFTTVAELNAGTHGQLVGAAGGQWMFWLSLLGIGFLFFRKKDDEWYPLYGILVAAWFISTYYAGLTGVRFMALFAPVAAFGIAGLIGILTGERVKKWSKSINMVTWIIPAIVIIVGLIFVAGTPMKNAHNVAMSEVPSYDDTWDAAMKTINESSERAIITSWWDFGHWFEAMSERSVTFDGGDQGKRIHWVGKTLLTSDEDEALDILKMLNCGQEENYNLLEEYLGDKLEATNVLYEITRLDRDDAYDVLVREGLTNEQANNVLEYTHCSDLYDMYYITSGDMVGKATVWGHFGSWDFNRAYMYYKLRQQSIDTAIPEAQERLGYSEEEAKQLYLEVQGLANEDQAGAWISPWPQYATGSPVGCIEKNSTIGCEYNIGIGNQNGATIVIYRAVIDAQNPEESYIMLRAVNQNNQIVGSDNVKPASLSIADEDGEFERTEFENPGVSFGITLFEQNGEYKSIVAHPLHTESLFTRLFFMEGLGTEHFEKVFDDTAPGEGRVIVWKVNP